MNLRRQQQTMDPVLKDSVTQLRFGTFLRELLCILDATSD